MKIISHSRFKPVLVVLGWAASMAALTLATIFQGLLLPKALGIGGNEVINASPLGLWIFYLGNFGICILAAMVISDFGVAIVSFFPAYIGAGLLTYLLLALPDFIGVFPLSGVLQASAVTFTFSAFFPFLLVVSLAGTITGVGLAEHFL